MTEEIRCEIKNRRELNRRQRNCNAENREENWGRYLRQKELVKQMIRKELGEHEKRVTQEIREAKDSGQKMWNIINKLKNSEKTEMEIPLYSEEGECIEESQLPGEMMKYWENIYRGKENKMRNEWDGLRKDEYKEEWSYQIEFGGDMVIEYDNKQIYKKIPDHLMINLKLNEGRMSKRSDGMYIVQ